MSDKQYVVIESKSPARGMKIFGPFDSEDEAMEWAADTYTHPYWWTEPLETPEFDIIEDEAFVNESGLDNIIQLPAVAIPLPGYAG